MHDLSTIAIERDCLVDYKLVSATSTIKKPKPKERKKFKVEEKSCKKLGGNNSKNYFITPKQVEKTIKLV